MIFVAFAKVFRSKPGICHPRMKSLTLIVSHSIPEFVDFLGTTFSSRFPLFVDPGMTALFSSRLYTKKG